MDSEISNLNSLLNNINHLLCNWETEISFELYDALTCEQQLINSKINSLRKANPCEESDTSSDDSLESEEDSDSDETTDRGDVVIDLSINNKKLKQLVINIKNKKDS